MIYLDIYVSVLSTLFVVIIQKLYCYCCHISLCFLLIFNM